MKYAAIIPNIAGNTALIPRAHLTIKPHNLSVNLSIFVLFLIGLQIEKGEDYSPPSKCYERWFTYTKRTTLAALFVLLSE